MSDRISTLLSIILILLIIAQSSVNSQVEYDADGLWTSASTPIASMSYVHGDGSFDNENGLDNYLTGTWPTAAPTP